MVLDLRDSLLDLLSDSKEKLVIHARRRSPLSSTGAAERMEKKMVSSARTPPPAPASSTNKSSSPCSCELHEDSCRYLLLLLLRGSWHPAKR
jgi:hypothetical protein